MRLNDALRAISARLKATFPGIRECAPHPGRFDEAELKRVATRAPALFVSCLGCLTVTNPGTEQADASLALAVYIVTQSVPGLPRDAGARNLAEALVTLVPLERWGLSGCGEAQAVRATNLYSGDVDKLGVALWAVSWQQTLRLGDSVFAADGTLPRELYLGIEPDVGIGHEPDYRLVGP